MSFSISDNAVRRLQVLKQQDGSPFFRVRVDTGGCKGFQYIFLMDDTQTADDVIFQKEDVAVIVDELSLSFLQGAFLDYVEEMMGASFTISNPNIAGSCGCKNSFSMGAS